MLLIWTSLIGQSVHPVGTGISVIKLILINLHLKVIFEMGNICRNSYIHALNDRFFIITTVAHKNSGVILTPDKTMARAENDN